MGVENKTTQKNPQGAEIHLNSQIGGTQQNSTMNRPSSQSLATQLNSKKNGPQTIFQVS